MEVEVEVEVEILVDTVAKVGVEKLGNTARDVDTEAVVHMHDECLQVKAGRIDDTLGTLQCKALLDNLANTQQCATKHTWRQIRRS